MERFKDSLKLNVYIKIDTGLNRIGAKPEEALNLAKKVLSYKNLILEGISTHYASADMNDEESINFTKKQIITFNEVVNNLKENNIKLNIIHSANSAAILSYKESYFNMVRAGIILYGYPQIETNLKIKKDSPSPPLLQAVRNIATTGRRNTPSGRASIPRARRTGPGIMCGFCRTDACSVDAPENQRKNDV